MSDLSAFDLEPGGTVGGYELLSRLGSGAMGTVWKVKDDGGHVYAMKMLRDSLAEDGGAADESTGDPNRRRDAITARERLRREAMALRRVDHPGVCGIVDMELDDALAFIVTEFIEGKTLREDVTANGRYVGDDLERLAAKLIDAVKAVHAAGIVHRDIKPTNVMIAASGPVLVDFGIAMGEGESHVTRTGLVMGTPGFIAPEIIDGAESTEATDWWSVASVLGFAATGRPVFGVKPMMAVLEREASGNADLSGLPHDTMQALRAALSPDPARRPTMTDVLHTITLDALNPQAWLQSEDDETTMMHPFDGIAGSTDTTGGPRRLWQDDARTIAPAAIGQQDTAVFDPDPDRTGGDDDQTIAAPTAASATTATTAATTVLAAAPPTAILPQRPPSYPASAAGVPVGLEPTGLDPAAPRPTPLNPTPLNPAPLSPAPPLVDATALKRDAYYASGNVAVWLLTVPLAMLGACAPVIALAAFAIIVWILVAVGHNSETQLAREWHRGGTRTGGDWLLRILSLPWHLLGALPAALLRLIIPAACTVMASLLGVIVLQLPQATTSLYWQGHRFALPLLLDHAISYSGLLLAAAMAISWLLAAFGPHSARIRLGAGTIRGRTPSRYVIDSANDGQQVPRPNSSERPESPPATHEDGRTARWSSWHMTLLALWLIMCAAVILTMLMSPAIIWFPLPLAFT